MTQQEEEVMMGNEGERTGRVEDHPGSRCQGPAGWGCRSPSGEIQGRRRVRREEKESRWGREVSVGVHVSELRL